MRKKLFKREVIVTNSNKNQPWRVLTTVKSAAAVCTLFGYYWFLCTTEPWMWREVMNLLVLINTRYDRFCAKANLLRTGMFQGYRFTRACSEISVNVRKLYLSKNSIKIFINKKELVLWIGYLFILKMWPPSKINRKKQNYHNKQYGRQYGMLLNTHHNKAPWNFAKNIVARFAKCCRMKVNTRTAALN